MIIAIIGEQGAGKDTVRKLIQYYFAFPHAKFIEDLPHWFTMTDRFMGELSDCNKYKFASIPKQHVANFLGVDVTRWQDRIFKEKHREKLVAYSEFIKDTFSKDIWIKETFKDIEWEEELGNFIHYVIDDAGFTLELEKLEEKGALIFKVTRPNVTPSDQPRETEMRAWKNIDLELDNSGDFDYLYKQIENYFNTLNTY